MSNPCQPGEGCGRKTDCSRVSTGPGTETAIVNIFFGETWFSANNDRIWRSKAVRRIVGPVAKLYSNVLTATIDRSLVARAIFPVSSSRVTDKKQPRDGLSDTRTAGRPTGLRCSSPKTIHPLAWRSSSNLLVWPRVNPVSSPSRVRITGPNQTNVRIKRALNRLSGLLLDADIVLKVHARRSGRD